MILSCYGYRSLGVLGVGGRIRAVGHRTKLRCDGGRKQMVGWQESLAWICSWMVVLCPIRPTRLILLCQRFAPSHPPLPPPFFLLFTSSPPFGRSRSGVRPHSQQPRIRQPVPNSNFEIVTDQSGPVHCPSDHQTFPSRPDRNS